MPSKELPRLDTEELDEVERSAVALVCDFIIEYQCEPSADVRRQMRRPKAATFVVNGLIRARLKNKMSEDPLAIVVQLGRPEAEVTEALIRHYEDTIY